MPIKIQKDLPAKVILESENIFVMDEERAMSQDIRPLEILIMNLMPVKEDTETQLLRAVEHSASGGLHISDAGIPCIKEYVGQPFE